MNLLHILIFIGWHSTTLNAQECSASGGYEYQRDGIDYEIDDPCTMECDTVCPLYNGVDGIDSCSAPHVYSCNVANYHREQGSHRTRAWCDCQECTKDCSISDVDYMVDKCDIDSIPAIEVDADGKFDAVFDETLNQIIGLVGFMGPHGAALSFGLSAGKAIFAAANDFDDQHAILNGVIEDINNRFEDMLQCMDEKIDESDGEDIIGEMSEAINLFDLALATSDAPLIQAQFVRYAWVGFMSCVNNKFRTYRLTPKGTVYYVKILDPLQDFALLYALTSTDYLLWLKKNNMAEYASHFELTLEDFTLLRQWVYDAKDQIYPEIVAQMHESNLPCQNEDSINAELREWKAKFIVANIFPIEQYIANLQKIQRSVFPGDACLTPTESQEVIHVLSVDHSCMGDGKFFYFDSAEADAIFGNVDWDGWAARIYNERTGITENVRLTKESDGLIWVGDARGRREFAKYADYGNWQVGDVLVYRPNSANSYSVCFDGYECVQGTCQSSFKPIDDLSQECSTRPTVKVLSVDHDKAADGMYFNFDIAQMDAAMGEGNWESRLVPAFNYRTGLTRDVVMWRADRTDSEGDGHGRFFHFDHKKRSDWQIGDELAFNLGSSECGDGFYCIPDVDGDSSFCEHARCNGDNNLKFINVGYTNKEGEWPANGQYFRFDADSMDLDNLLGADWESKSWEVYNSRTKEVISIRIWPNEGVRIWPAEGGHGRLDPKSESSTGDFHYGDRLIFNYGSSDGCGDNLHCLPVGEIDFACREAAFDETALQVVPATAIVDDEDMIKVATTEVPVVQGKRKKAHRHAGR